MLDRETREARALAVIKAISPDAKRVSPLFKPKFVNPPPVHTNFGRFKRDPCPPPKPDPTFTLIGFPEGTEYAANIVYFMYSSGRIKIGHAGTVRTRHRGLKYAGAFPPIVLLVLQGGEAAERKLHRQFAKDRLHGEWFAISKEMRTYLRQRLCDVGRASFEKAESEFREYCQGFLAGYRPLEKKLKFPAEKKPKPLCPHGTLISGKCYPCERTRDLAIMERINNGTYSAKSVDHA